MRKDNPAVPGYEIRKLRRQIDDARGAAGNVQGGTATPVDPNQPGVVELFELDTINPRVVKFTTTSQVNTGRVAVAHVSTQLQRDSIRSTIGNLPLL